MIRASNRFFPNGRSVEVNTGLASSESPTDCVVQATLLEAPVFDTMSPRVIQYINVVGPTLINALISGGSDIERLQVVRAIHDASIRRLSSLVVLDCSDASSETITVELSGAVLGSPRSDALGVSACFELAYKGTLLLQNIDGMSIPLQRHVLSVLKSRQTGRADTKLRRIDVRLVATCRETLSRLVKEQAFDAELYHLLNICPMEISSRS